MDDVEYGWKNIVEVALVIRIVHNLYKEWKCLRQQLNVTIVSTYTAQVVEIKEKLGEKYSNFDGFTVRVVDIIELLEGEKADVIVLSTVRSNSEGSIGLLSNPERVKSVFTSARDCLWILGDERALCRGTSSIWKSIIRDAKARKCFFNVEEHEELGKCVVKVKKELDELNEMLNPDSFLFRNSKWKVSFSDSFVNSFVKIKSSQKKSLVMNFLLRLANGWRPKSSVSITCVESKQCLKQYKVKDFHVICSIDIENEGYRYVQVLKVWDVLPLVDVPELVRHLDTMFLTYTTDDLDRCKIRYVKG
uniref:DNA2/NAM7 helicase-like C-terminal domain-containing protein n=1 Tax=Cannabis sativa TaxID=3483 RepID=A0A803Q3A3_CANSA